MDRFVVISGCSGGGKSALLSELGRRGHGVVEEPGRRILAEELEDTGGALPWVNLAAFAQRAIAISLGSRLVQSQKAMAVARATPDRKLAASLS